MNYLLNQIIYNTILTYDMPNNNYYKEYTNFTNTYNPHKDPSLKIAKKYDWFDIVINNKYLIISSYLRIKYDKQPDKQYYNLNYNIIRNFPQHLILDWIRDHKSLEFNAGYLHIEVIKYIFYAYKNINEVNNSIQLEINKIEKKLNKLANKPVLNKWQGRYDLAWLYAYCVLFDNYEELILKLADIVYLDDAQDTLMYGIYQMDSDKLAPFIKQLLLKLDYQKKTFVNRDEFFDPTCYGTGALEQVLMVFTKLHHNGYNIMDDPEIVAIFEDQMCPRGCKLFKRTYRKLHPSKVTSIKGVILNLRHVIKNLLIASSTA